MLFFLIRITKNEIQLRTYYIGLAVTATLTLVTVLVTSIDCPTAAGFYWAFYDNRRSCSSQNVRWHVSTAFDVASEIGLLVLPVQLVWELQMPLRKKAMVLIAFYLRLPVIALTIVRELSTNRLADKDSDPSYGGAMVVIWMEIQLAYSLAANTLSALKAFTESFNSGFGQGFTRGKGSQYDMSDMSKASYQSSRTEKRMGKPPSGSSTTAKKLQDGVQEVGAQDRGQKRHEVVKLRPDHDGENTTRVSAEPGKFWRADNRSSSSDRSGDEMVIVRETELSIHHDHAPMLG